MAKMNSIERRIESVCEKTRDVEKAFNSYRIAAVGHSSRNPNIAERHLEKKLIDLYSAVESSLAELGVDASDLH